MDSDKITGTEIVFSSSIGGLTVDSNRLFDEHYLNIGEGPGGLNMKLEQISVFRNTIKLRKLTHPNACYYTPITPTNTNPCKIEALFTP
jgi:hypothetical protein